jgi:hypothetical protein
LLLLTLNGYQILTKSKLPNIDLGDPPMHAFC